MVLSTALFDNPDFNNIITNGLVLGGDGNKMTKSLKNYPNPNLLINQYGTNTLRFDLIKYLVVRA